MRDTLMFAPRHLSWLAAVWLCLFTYLEPGAWRNACAWVRVSRVHGMEQHARSSDTRGEARP